MTKRKTAKTLGVIISSICILSTISISAFASYDMSVMYTNGSHNFNNYWSESTLVYDAYANNTLIGQIEYGYKYLFGTRDYCNLGSNSDYSHYCVIINGKGSSSGPSYHVSNTKNDSGIKYFSVAHKGPGVSYGGTIVVN